ncbi:MAG: S8 family serine peptidase, partial [Rivularia sp. ALOHA_DT_140]|nr:S8 family serine peptidase [Rivularia sp. ALOHA_DT_140]
MKQHIRLKLKQGISDKKIPHWQDILDNKKIAGEKLEGAIDKIFAKYKLPVWVTKEYKPAAQYWGRDELKSGLNRIYRLILQHHSRIPRELIQEVSLVPIVESVEVGEVGKANLPSMIPAQMSVQTDLRSRLEVGLSEAQYYTRGVYDITVAVLDTGIDLSHPELEDVLLPGQDFVNIIDGANQFLGDYLDYDDVPDDEVGHGTHVAGIIAAKGL